MFINTDDGFTKLTELISDDPKMTTLAVQVFVEQLRLFSRLVAGRNLAWKKLLSQSFPAEFLAGVVWNNQLKPMRGNPALKQAYFLICFSTCT
jgi:hypothetical protein